MFGNTILGILTALCLFSVVTALPKRQTLSIEDIQTQALANAYKVLDGTLSDGMTRAAGCSKGTVSVRKE